MRIGRRDLVPLSVFAGAALVLVAIAIASRVVDRSLEELSQDPTETLGAPAYIGILSTLAVIGWSAALTAALVGWAATVGSTRSAFLWGGLLTGALLADDAFRLHESYYPTVGVPEGAVAAAYVLAGIAFLVVTRDFIRKHGPILLLVSIALLGSASLSDQLLEEDAPFVAEEGAKFLGVVGWALFFGRAAVAEAYARRPADPSASA